MLGVHIRKCMQSLSKLVQTTSGGYDLGIRISQV